MEELRIIAASSQYLGAVRSAQSIFPLTHYLGNPTLDDMLGQAHLYKQEE